MNENLKNGSLKIEREDLEKLVQKLMQWSAINSGSYHIAGLERMADVFMEDFEILGSERRIVPLPPVAIINTKGRPTEMTLGPLLRFRKRREAPLQVLLVGHMDTVFEADHPFQSPIRKENNILQGPGVADMKGGILVMLEAMKAFEQHPLRDRIGWEIFINPDEEIGSIGSANELTRSANENHLALLFEPAMDEKGTLVGNRSGSGKFTIVVRGKSAHVGRDFEAGANAIVAIAKIIEKLSNLNGKREGVKINVGQIEGGGAVNRVPDLAICRFDVRINQVEDEAWISDNLHQITNDSDLPPGIRVEMFGKFTRIPRIIDKTAKKLYDLVLEVAGELGQNLSVRPSGGCSDGNNLSAVGLPNVDTMGVCGGNIHTNEEYVLIDSIEKRINLTYGVLCRLAVNGKDFLQ